MRLIRLWLEDFRSYERLDLTFADGVTVLCGPNGAGKTNVVEAIAWLNRAGSFRVSASDALVRHGAHRAVIRAELEEGERRVTVEIELPVRGRPRVLLNRQRLPRSGDLAALVPVSVFSPDDLEIVKGGPSERRGYLDGALAVLSTRGAKALTDLDRVLRQRNALLAGCHGRLDDDARRTLDVWDAKLVSVGTDVAHRRVELVADVTEPIRSACHRLVGMSVDLQLEYRPSWDGDLAEALDKARTDDVRRGVSTVGPHRDDLAITLAGMPARTHASQGEQRTLALAMRIGVHVVRTEITGSTPILVLDDVFSELDEDRSARLVATTPAGQTIITTAAPLHQVVAASGAVTVDLGTFGR